MPDSLNASRRQGRILAFAAFLITTFALLLVAGRADAATTLSNTAPITIKDSTANGTAMPASVYPSKIDASSLTGTIQKVTATVTGFKHTCTTDVDMLLVGPQGQKSILMSDGGDCANTVTHLPINLTFSNDPADGGVKVPCFLDSNGAPVPGKLLGSGTYLPTDYLKGTTPGPTGACSSNNVFEDSFPNSGAVVGPGTGPFPADLTAFNGTNPAGTWSLFVVDQYKGDSGSISGGWSLTFTINPPTVSAPGISGTPQVGQTLSAVSGTITNGGAATWQWNRCDGSGSLCQPIAGANGVTYAPAPADVGHTLTLTETVTNSGGTDSKSSGATGIVAAAPVVTPPTPTPTPTPTPNKIPAHISTSGLKTKQKVLSQHGILATLTTSITGKLVATATVSVPKLAKVYRFTTVRATVVAGNRTTVLLKLSRSGLNAIKKALRKHKRLSAKLTMVVTTASGAKTTVHKTIRLVR